jgi:hypothetical protein
MEIHEESDHVRLVLIELQMAEIRREMQAQTQATQDLIEAWRSAKGSLIFLQTLAKIIGALGVIYLGFKGIKGHFHG